MADTISKIKVNELETATPKLTDTLLASGDVKEYACKVEDLKEVIGGGGGGLNNVKDATNGGIIEGLVNGNEGEVNVASGENAHAEGGFIDEYEEDGQIIKKRAINIASGYVSHAEGAATTASGDFSHAEGYHSIASNTMSHAEGNDTTASGEASHAEGEDTIASGDNSHAEGWFTIANHASQHVFGAFNIEDPSTATTNNRGTYVEIVGNGLNSDYRSNARTLDWDGNEWLKGSISADGGLKLKSPDGSSFTIHVANDGTLSATKNT